MKCKLCRREAKHLTTSLCVKCWGLSTRIEEDFELAEQILREVHSHRLVNPCLDLLQGALRAYENESELGTLWCDLVRAELKKWGRS